MKTDFFPRIRTFLGTRLPVGGIGGYRFVLQLIMVFAVFYFATFEFFAEPHEIVRGIVEFFLVSFSLCAAIAILSAAGALLSLLRGKALQLLYGHMLPVFAVVYTGGMGILYPLKQLVWDIQKEWFWKYYWRHLPGALLILCLFLYREYKNAVVGELIGKINLGLEERERRKGAGDSRTEGEPPVVVAVDGLPTAIPLSAITHISADGHYLDVYYAAGGQEYEHVCIRKTLTEMMDELPKGTFLRTHRSHIVNPAHITGLVKEDRRCFADLCNGGFSVPVSRNNLARVLSFLEGRLSAKSVP